MLGCYKIYPYLKSISWHILFQTLINGCVHQKNRSGDMCFFKRTHPKFYTRSNCLPASYTEFLTLPSPRQRLAERGLGSSGVQRWRHFGCLSVAPTANWHWKGRWCPGWAGGSGQGRPWCPRTRARPPGRLAMFGGKPCLPAQLPSGSECPPRHRCGTADDCGLCGGPMYIYDVNGYVKLENLLYLLIALNEKCIKY